MFEDCASRDDRSAAMVVGSRGLPVPAMPVDVYLDTTMISV